MDERFASVAAIAAAQHAVVSLDQLDRLGVGRRARTSWVARGVIERVGPRSFVLCGSPQTWWRDLWCAQCDLSGRGFVAGRSGARLLGLDGFVGKEVELLATREHRGLRTGFTLHTTASALDRGDTVTIEGIRCVTAQRLILDAPLFGFDRGEIERAIDSAIRLRKVSEQRLRTAVIARHRSGINGSRMLLEALVDTGGESRLERWLLGLVRRAGLPRPSLQRVVRDGSRVVARVDAEFPGGLIVEVEGHATHSSRRQRQADEERRTALVRRGFAVLVFTYLDVRERPGWVADQIRSMLVLAA